MNKIRTLLWATLFLIATSAITAGAAPFAYVANLGGGVSVIDTATNTVAATVQVGIGSQGVAITPNGAFAYVANFDSNNVSVIDTATNTVVATVPVGIGPLGVAVAPSGAFAYVTAFDSCLGSVSVIDTTANSPTVNTVVATVSPLGGCPTGVAIAPSGAFAYVANFTANNVAVINTATNTVLTTVPVGSGPRGVAITPNGAFAYVANSISNDMSVIDTATNTVIATIASGAIAGGPFGVAITPNGAFAYVSVFDTLSCTGGVWVIDTATNIVAATVSPLESCPAGVATTPNGAFVYVTHSGFGPSANSVSVIDTASNSVVAAVTVGVAPESVAVSPAIVPLHVAIDIKPGGGSNNINTTSQSLIRVAILSSSDFDAFARVDPSSVTFGRTGDERSLAFCDASASDVNGDGLSDLVCHFFKNLTAFQVGDTVGVLKGGTVDGTPIMGTDAVRVVR
jgi:YVTN family beta-propeller protein